MNKVSMAQTNCAASTCCTGGGCPIGECCTSVNDMTICGGNSCNLFGHCDQRTCNGMIILCILRSL